MLAEQTRHAVWIFLGMGSEADLHGVCPRYYLKFYGSFPHRKRAARVLAWLRFPPTEQSPRGKMLSGITQSRPLQTYDLIKQTWRSISATGKKPVKMR
jgi:hypothetical protein